jgi:predicted ATP-dependent protease
MRLPAVANTVDEARDQARKAGRSQILSTDIRAALHDYQIPSDEALRESFQPTKKRPELAIRADGGSFASILQRRSTRVA